MLKHIDSKKEKDFGHHYMEGMFVNFCDGGEYIWCTSYVFLVGPASSVQMHLVFPGKQSTYLAVVQAVDTVSWLPNVRCPAMPCPRPNVPCNTFLYQQVLRTY
jgi:hypothetical protein